MSKQQHKTPAGTASPGKPGSDADSAAATASASATTGARALYLVVFLSGAALMGLEMAGARLVEPHFGSTIYVWGSIIGVFMLALSLGYWGGGKLSDKSPKIETLGVILLLAALLVVVVPPIAPWLCMWMNQFEGLDVRYRTLITCLILFAPPSICMGMVSPFGVRLAAKAVAVLGSVAGSLYAVSTLGSIVGTLLVSFVLIEVIGTTAIVYSVGVVLAGVAVFCFFLGGGGFRKAGTALAILGVGGGYFGAATPLTVAAAYAGDSLLETKESAYHYISILNSRSQVPPYQLPARLMLFNNLIESGIILDPATRELPAPPAQTACGYIDMLHLGMVLTGQPPTNMLVLGCGGGVGPRVFKENYTGGVKSIDVVDIDPMVFSLAEKWFAYPYSGDDVIHSHTMDARMYVERVAEPEKQWDYIIMDAYSSGGRIPKHLITEEFFTSIRDRLTPDGVMVINVISSIEKPAEGIDHSRLYRSVYKTLEKVYDTAGPDGGGLYVFPRHRSGVGENIIILATKNGIERIGIRDFARRYRAVRNRLFSHTQLDDVVTRQLAARPETDDVPILTDDFCPTDSMVHR